MFGQYDIFTIYNFYETLGKKIDKLINYCIANYDDEKLINEMVEIEKEYVYLVKEFEDYLK